MLVPYGLCDILAGHPAHPIPQLSGVDRVCNRVR